MPVTRSAGQWVDRWLLLGTFVCLAVLALHRLFAYDIWWQIAAGRQIAGHGIPEVDPFSFGFADRPWVEPRWLWCLAVWAVYAGGGVNFLILLKLALLAAAGGLLVAAAAGRPRWAVTLGLSLVLATAHERFMVRPELVSFVALAATLLCVQQFKDGGSSRWLWGLPAMQVVWCNTHTLWVLGPVTLWIVVLAEWVEGRAVDRGVLAPRNDRIAGARLGALASAALATSATTLVNPYFVRGVLFPLDLLHEIRAGHMFSETIAEFRGPFSDYFFSADFRTTAFVAAIVVSFAALVANRRRVPLYRPALWAAYLFVAVEAQRNVALFGWVAGFTLMLDLAQWHAAAPRRLTPVVVRATVASFLVVLIPAAASDRFYRSQGSLKRFGFGVSDHRFPRKALAFIREHDLPMPAFHALGDGGYVLFEGGPASVYADGRLEVYGSEILERAFRVTWAGEGLDAESDRTGADTIIVRNDIGYRPLLRRLERSGEWFPVYYDPLHLVYLRGRPATRERFAQLAFDWSSPPRFALTAPRLPADAPWLVDRTDDGYADERLGSLFAGVGNYELARSHFERAHVLNPRDARTRMFVGLFREAEGRQDEAARLLRSVPPGYLAEAEVHTLAGAVGLWAGNRETALAHFERARELGAAEPAASLLVARAALLAGETERASAALIPLIEVHGAEPELWNLMAVLEIKRGRPAEAAAHFEHSLELDPDQPSVRNQLRALEHQRQD
ncbi:MAG TPA: tetratricopeptide repeat protein [Candidatus Polarisedimenticolaceae bacterium]|nr:tetratricopeptide repeat protein [Candidatus Polarisedimenticolaceae bacterium]